MSVHAFKPRDRYYRKALYVPKGKDIQFGTMIRVQRMGELQKRFTHAIQNLTTSRNSTVFITNYMIDKDKKSVYNPGDHLYMGVDNDPENWTKLTIKTSSLFDMEKNEQARRFFKDTVGIYWVIEVE